MRFRLLTQGGETRACAPPEGLRATLPESSGLREALSGRKRVKRALRHCSKRGTNPQNMARHLFLQTQKLFLDLRPSFLRRKPQPAPCFHVRKSVFRKCVCIFEAKTAARPLCFTDAKAVIDFASVFLRENPLLTPCFVQTQSPFLKLRLFFASDTAAPRTLTNTKPEFPKCVRLFWS